MIQPSVEKLRRTGKPQGSYRLSGDTDRKLQIGTRKAREGKAEEKNPQ
jgi:hypothetical protein